MLLDFERYNPIGIEEKKAVMRVLDSGCLSGFIGSWCDDFYGGVEVREFEKELADYFQVKHAITFNSLTSGLIASLGAIGIKPGDEVIVSPWTMSATATAILFWGGIPVFVDIETDYYGLDPDKVAAAVTEHTRAVMVTNIFGHGAKLKELSDICLQHNLKLIEDVAQAPGIKYQGKFCGTWGEIGGFSLNYHKHIHTGEGGFCLTQNDELALKMQMIRNHAEACVEGSPINDITNMVGYNFRMGEMEAAIGREQLKKLPTLLNKNQNKSRIFNRVLSTVKDFKLAKISINSDHAFYVLPIQIVGGDVSREAWISSLLAMGIPGLMAGYINVHRLPMYENKIAFGRGYPWNMANRVVQYGKGVCPKAEKLQDDNFIGFLISMYELTEEQCEFIAQRMVDTWNKMN